MSHLQSVIFSCVVLLLPACDQRVSLSTWVVGPPRTHEMVQTVIDDWGFPMVMGGPWDATIVIAAVPTQTIQADSGVYQGFGIEMGKCGRLVLVDETNSDEFLMLHELGHVIGRLAHSSDPTNIMHKMRVHVPTPHFTDEQWASIDSGVLELSQCAL